jgi:hypothetical protein
MVVCSFAGGGVGKLEREPQDAKYRSNSSSVISLVIEKAGESSILKMSVVVIFVMFVNCFDVCEFRASCTAMVGVVLPEQSFQCFVCRDVNWRIETSRWLENSCRREQNKRPDNEGIHSAIYCCPKKTTVFETVKRLTVRSLARCSSLTRSGLPAATPSPT